MGFFGRLQIVLFTAFIFSCGHSPIHGAVPAGKPPLYLATLWIQEDPLLPPQLVLEGCQAWAPLGVGCKIVQNPGDALVRFNAVRTPCTPDPKEHTIIIATAHSDRHIEMLVNCLVGNDGKPDELKIRMVVAHEFGHEEGIWKHVPLECDDKDTTYVMMPDGKKLCGEAVMNPVYDDDVTEITDMDGHAFDMRDRNYTIIHPVSESDGSGKPVEVICTYGSSE